VKSNDRSLLSKLKFTPPVAYVCTTLITAGEDSYRGPFYTPFVLEFATVIRCASLAGSDQLAVTSAGMPHDANSHLLFRCAVEQQRKRL
jgi:hypothetical protein